MEATLVPFNLGKFLFHADPANNIALQPLDQIFIFDKWLFKDKPFISVEGEIRGVCSPSFGSPTNGGREQKTDAANAKIQALELDLKRDPEGNKNILFKLKNISDEIKIGERAPEREIL